VNWASYRDGFSSLFEQGGGTLWAILFASLLLWVLIVERYFAHRQQLPAFRDRLRHQLYEEREQGLSGAQAIRRIRSLTADLKAEAAKNLPALNALTTILPLLGLLGTVSGMIKVFDVITVFGTGNARGMASGISEALVTTMAGLFTALSGLFFVSDLENRNDEMVRRFESEMFEGQ
jgi:biopolymer transport protein ExbB